MTKRIVVQGEFHTSPSDARELIADNPDAEVLFIEGRSDTIDITDRTVGYAFFLLGYLQIRLLYTTVSWLQQKRGTEFDIESEANDAGLDSYCDIDLELDECYHESAGGARKLAFGVSLCTLIAGALFPVWNGFISTPLPTSTGLILFAVAPFLYFYAVIAVILHQENVRDTAMAKSVVQHTRDGQYDSVLLLVGDSHVSGIESYLNGAGWDVTAHRSQHRLMRLNRWIFE
ncbi:hypothetical protein PM023_13200 [Halorubrum ezzemoulense]|uniref:hypothetical protein n=1 Tax=Halorubrum ezzemoulense TaxID=337243 RepID=UPI00232E0AB7|nr:hypothetical protein [Halorubrum ezzemoulense]MDB2225627.1 hypothetical protein [Halorubrum ezzemoulense]